MNGKAIGFRCFLLPLLNDGLDLLSAIAHKIQAKYLLPINYNNRPHLVQRLGDQSSLFEPKHVFLLHISTKVTCTNTSLNYSNSWHLILQTCFHCKTYCVSLSVPPVMQFRKQKKPLQCRFWHILACVYSLFSPL